MKLIKQVVPWFDKQEWEEVYNLAYSMDPDLQKKAYQQMAIWRARVSNLCMGVECTQAFLHVRLCEIKKKDDGTPAFEDIDLQPIYSTAVMRFLNHLQGFCNNKTLYQMAQMYDIPDWIVNMRHETAHGNKLPTLYLLRDASNFIFEWLNKNYWESEMSNMVDLVLDPPKLYDMASVEMTLEKLLELWKCVKLYHMGGFEKIEDVPNSEELSGAISELQNICQQKDHSKKKFNIFGKISNYILHCIFKMFEFKTINKQHAEQSLISTLLNNQSFLPPVSLQKKFFNEPAIEILLNIWEEIIIEIQKHGLMLNLLRALIEITNDCSDLRHNIAALWIHCLASSLKFKRINKQVKLSENVIIRVLEQLTEKLSSHLCPPDIVEFAIKASYQTFKQSLPLEPLSYVGRNNVRQVVKEALLSPNEYTTLYISSLLDLWEPPLTSSNKLKLCRLVKLYTKEINFSVDNEDTTDDLMSLQMLLGTLNTTIYDSTEPVNEIAKEVDCDEELLSNNSQAGNWTIYSGEENWGKCPLGRIPWQNQNFFQIPMDKD